MVWIKTVSWIGLMTLLFTYEEDVRIHYLQGLEKYIYANPIIQLLVEILTWGIIYVPAIIALGYLCFKKDKQ